MERRHRNALVKGYQLHWYEIDSILGQGGFGITYLARDTNLDQLVAIKEFLPQELAVREDDSSVHPVTDGHADTFGWGLSRFLSEARTLAKFRHPNIVLVHSVFEANNTAYMVMEYEHGRSLDDALKFRKLEGETQLKAMVWPLLDGLELMHEAGFIHRDIKPGNIFIREDGTPVLLDFGSARLALGGQTRTLTTLVSPGYAPFEQYETSSEGGRQGPWTDLYSLAATLYMAIAGHGPPDAVTRANARLDNRPDPLIPARMVAPAGYSPGFLYAIDAGLAFAAADRPKNVAQWRHMLESTDAPDVDDDRTVVRSGPAPETSPADTRPRVAGADTSDAIRNADSRGTDARRRSPAPPAAREPATPAKPASSGGRRGAMVALLLVVLAALGAGGWYASRFWMQQDTPPVVVSAPPAPAATTPETPPVSAVTPAPAPEAPAVPVAPPAPAVPALVTEQSEADRQRAQLEAELERMRESMEAAAPAAPTTSEPAPAPSAPVSAEQARVDAMLAAAEQDMRAGRMVEPVDGSAMYRYHDVLDLQPDNETAHEGLRRIVATLASDASVALSGGRLDEAEQKLRQAEVVNPRAAEVVQLRGRLDDTRAALSASREVERQRVEDQARQAAEADERRAAEERARAAADERARLAAEQAARRDAEARARVAAEEAAKRAAEERARLAAAAAEAQRAAEERARQAAADAAARQAQGGPLARIPELLEAAAVDLGATRLTSPAGSNAYDKYQEVLSLDPGNREANAGMQRIVERYLDLADASARDGRYDRAESYLRRAESVTPGSELVAASRATLAEASARATARAPEPEPQPVVVAAPAAAVVAAVTPSAPAAPVVPAPPPKPKMRKPAHLAIAPIETKRNCFASDDIRVRDAVLRRVRETLELVVVYNAYDESDRASVMQRVWQGPRTERTPVVAQAQALASAADADIVFMAFVDCGTKEQANPERFEYKFWALDVTTNNSYTQIGRMSDISGGVNALLEDAAAARRGR